MEIRALSKIVGLLLILLVTPVLGGGVADATPVQAQEAPVELEWLTVDLWPDFDRDAVLVLLTGSLAPGVTPPVEMAIPLPEGATINAVARVADDDQMLADLDPQVGSDFVTFTLPDRRFRVEYYYPYEADGLTRNFRFNWLAPELEVDNLSLAVQQPALALEMDTDPAPEMVTTGEDQLDYYNLPDEGVPAGEPYVVDIAYTLGEERLTVATAEDPPAVPTTPAAVEESGLALDWPLVLGAAGVLLILLAVGWQIFSSRRAGPNTAPRKPRPASRARRQTPRNSPGKARFCHNCGEQAQPGDRFCRECGTELKA